MKWLSVLDSVPGDMEDVLLFDQTEGAVIGYHKQNVYIQSADGLKLTMVSHWMPIPQAPALSKEDEISLRVLKEAFAKVEREK